MDWVAIKRLDFSALRLYLLFAVFILGMQLVPLEKKGDFLSEIPIVYPVLNCSKRSISFTSASCWKLNSTIPFTSLSLLPCLVDELVVRSYSPLAHPAPSQLLLVVTLLLCHPCGLIPSTGICLHPANVFLFDLWLPSAFLVWILCCYQGVQHSHKSRKFL